MNYVQIGPKHDITKSYGFTDFGLVNGLLYHSTESLPEPMLTMKFGAIHPRAISQRVNPSNTFEIYTFKITATSPNSHEQN